MSLYNQIFNFNANGGYLLSVLDLNPADFERFRDVSVRINENGNPIIVVYTRLGGGNRDDYQHIYDKMKQHWAFVRDYDDTFDSTYAYFEFLYDPEHDPVKERAECAENIDKSLREIAKINDPRSVGEKFQTLVEDMKSQKENEETKRALEVGKRIMEPIAESLENKEGTVKVIEV